MNIKNILYRYKSCVAPFRTAVAAVAVSVIATAAVTVVSAVGKQIIQNEMDAVGMNGLAVTSYNSKGENTTDEMLLQTISQIKTTKNATPVIVENCTVQFSNGIKTNTVNWGINGQADKVVSLDVTAGRMFSQNEIQSKSRVCIVDEELAIMAYNRNNICGKNIVLTTNGRAERFEIIGTVKKGSNILNNLTGDIVPYFVYTPYTVMSDTVSKSGFDQIVFTTQDTQQTQQQIHKKLTQLNEKYSRQNIVLTNLAQQKSQLEKISDTAFAALFAVSCVAVLVCSMSVGASVNTAVISKQKDI
ncbi:MAG: ABC transporter permease, partial [Oscillospiraceae bacterium]|nr:ABC transporter permease [Oscillospiraceae bacterium]